MKEKKVLIVDFDEASLVVLSDLINEEGFKAVAVTDGLAGYEKFKAEDFDLVILEPMLPKLHGFELCKKIIQDPLKKVPIIVLTGIYREPTCKAEAIQVYGASAFFTKPWNKEELRAKVLELLAATRDKEDEHKRVTEKEPKFRSDLDEIEKELREAVASLGGSSLKKDTKGKKPPKRDLDQEVEAILKGAISQLGLEETEKKGTPPRSTPTPRATSPTRPTPTPSFPPPSPPRTDPWREEVKVQVAEEIKTATPARESSSNNIPLGSSRAFDTENAPFKLDQTLLEIDKIPLDMEKPQPETRKEPASEEQIVEEKRKFLFDKEEEPRKRRVTIFAASGVAAVLVVATSLMFVLKSRKPSSPSPAHQMASVPSPSLPAEFSVRQEEVQSPIAEKRAEPAASRKLEEKKPASLPPEENPAQANVVLMPVVPEEAPPVQLHVEAALPSETLPAKDETSLPPPAQNPQADQPPATVAEPKKEEPEPAKTQPGDLVPLTEVTIPPVLIKRVDPKYPAAALTLGREGTVTVNALISETGEVIRTEILQGVKGGYGFEKAAESAVKQWLFKPAQKDGVSVKVWKPIEIIFKLSQIPTKE